MSIAMWRTFGFLDGLKSSWPSCSKLVYDKSNGQAREFMSLVNIGNGQAREFVSLVNIGNGQWLIFLVSELRGLDDAWN
jgi:hypothetical protein